MIGTKVKSDLKLDHVKINGDAKFNSLNVNGEITLNDTIIGNLYAQENIYRKIKTHATELGDKYISDEYFFLENVARSEIQRQILSKNIRTVYGLLKGLNKRSNLIRFVKTIKRQNKQVKYFIILSFFKTKQYGNYLLEIPMQHYFFYGVKPLRTFGYWLVIILFFSLIYWTGSWIYLNNSILPDNLPLSGLDISSYPRAFFFSVTNAMTPGWGSFTVKEGIPQFIAGIEAIFGAFTWGCFLAIIARKYMDK